MPLNHAKPLAVTFDMDETLIDKTPTGTLAFIDFCQHYGIPLQRSHHRQIERFRQRYFSDGESIKQSLESMGSKAFWLNYNRLLLVDVLGYEPENSLMESVGAAFTREYRPKVFMHDDVRDTLKKLKNLGIPIGIITTRNAGFDLGLDLGKVEQELEDLDVASYFTFVIGTSPSGQTKPHRSVFDAAAKSVNVPLQNLLHIGNDFYADYQGALDAGAQALLLDRNEFFEEVPGRICSMTEIFSLFEQSTGVK